MTLLVIFGAVGPSLAVSWYSGLKATRITSITDGVVRSARNKREQQQTPTVLNTRRRGGTKSNQDLRMVLARAT